MRHGVKNNHLGRKTPHRKALLRNLACQLIQHKRIVTTLAKAKALRVFVEPILTKSKTDDTHQRRVVFSYLQDKEAIKELFGTVSMKIADRPGGYCRIIKLERRLGDAADMAMIELVDFNDIYTNEKAKKTTRRSRRPGSKGDEATTVVESNDKPVAEVANEEPVAEVEPIAEVETVEEAAAPTEESAPETTEETTSEESTEEK